MEILKQGVLGGFRKRTGTVVEPNHPGQNIIPSLRWIDKELRSKGQTGQRMKFGMVAGFVCSAVPG